MAPPSPAATRPWPQTVSGGTVAGMARIGAVVLKVSDVDRAAAFWGPALDYEPDPRNPDFLRPRDGPGPRLHLDTDDRSHLDLWPDGDTEPSAEVERLIGLGARRVPWVYPTDADFVVLADPDDTLFCVIG